ncbi:cell division protein FtsQ/DivIB [Pseudoroseomonas globiformis]|uniref:Cell division protein FtsQ n=1 Tax=Teichococcus globiformis TaxID=2307229 RepID=A0ABV7G4G7_9PROT
MARSPTRVQSDERTRLSQDGRGPHLRAQRPNALRLWLRRQKPRLRPVLMGSVFAVLAGGCAVAIAALEPTGRFGWLADGIAGTAGRYGVVVGDIVVRGQQNTPRELIRNAIGTGRGEPLLAFSPTQTRARLESIAWIERAEVQRSLSGDILIVLHERQPFAIWQHNNEFAIIDRYGRVVTAETLDAFGPLPLLVGEGAQKAGGALHDALKSEPEVLKRVQALVYVSQRRWNLRLHNGTDVLLPDGHEDAAIRRLGELQRSGALMDRALVAIDMRMPDRLVVRQQPQPEEEVPVTKRRGSGRG